MATLEEKLSGAEGRLKRASSIFQDAYEAYSDSYLKAKSTINDAQGRPDFSLLNDPVKNQAMAKATYDNFAQWVQGNMATTASGLDAETAGILTKVLPGLLTGISEEQVTGYFRSNKENARLQPFLAEVAPKLTEEKRNLFARTAFEGFDDSDIPGIVAKAGMAGKYDPSRMTLNDAISVYLENIARLRDQMGRPYAIRQP